MKKQFLIIGTFLTCGLGFSQNTFPTGAGTNVGVGTTTPSTRLQITSATAGTSGVRLTNLTSTSATTTGNNKALSVDATGNIILTPVINTQTTDVSIYNNDGTLSANRTVNMNAKNLTINPSTANSQFFINGTTGNVGIGSISPTSKLDVSGEIKGINGIFSKSLPNNQTFSSWADRNLKCQLFTAGTIIDAPSQSRQFNFFDFPTSNFNANPEVFFTIVDRNSKDRLAFNAEAGNYSMLRLYDKNENVFVKIIEDGNDKVELTLPKSNSFVGIGTTNFIDGTDIYKLAVKGAIRADRVKVYTTWADFVFEKNYILPTLEDVEKHIQQNGHLKDIPSAKEVEANGIELGEMNKKLLQKVEELTLYIIEMNKELKEVKGKLKMN